MSVTLLIIIMTGVISFTALNDRGKLNTLLHSPFRESKNKEFYRFLTSGFVHGSMPHLLINMYVLYVFGEVVEQRFFIDKFGQTFGRIYYLGMYLLTIVLANIPTFLTHKNNAGFSSVGASGAISGILFVYILLYPWNMLLLFFIIPVPAIIAGILYLVYSSWAVKNSNDNIDHHAHFAGAIAGVAIAIVFRPEIINHFINQVSSVF